jgi:hypothetical protein
MRSNGFSLQHGSVDVSGKPLSGRDVSAVLRNLKNENPWLNACMRDCRQTNIGREQNQTYIFDKTAKVPTREELKTAKAAAKGSMAYYKAQIDEARAASQTEKKDATRAKTQRDKGER